MVEVEEGGCAMSCHANASNTSLKTPTIALQTCGHQVPDIPSYFGLCLKPAVLLFRHTSLYCTPATTTAVFFCCGVLLLQGDNSGGALHGVRVAALRRRPRPRKPPQGKPGEFFCFSLSRSYHTAVAVCMYKYITVQTYYCMCYTSDIHLCAVRDGCCRSFVSFLFHVMEPQQLQCACKHITAV